MFTVYLITKEQLGDRDFSELPVSDLQIEGRALTPEEFQDEFNRGQVDSSTQFIKIVAL